MVDVGVGEGWGMGGGGGVEGRKKGEKAGGEGLREGGAIKNQKGQYVGPGRGGAGAGAGAGGKGSVESMKRLQLKIKKVSK